jgi:hypothetical protein
MPMRNPSIFPKTDPVRLEVFKHLFSAIPEEMGVVLRKSSFSPNIKERRDYSCAIFNSTGNMIAQAANIPVHLGSMQLSVSSAIEKFSRNRIPLFPGDSIILNDPYQVEPFTRHHPGISVLLIIIFLLSINSKRNTRLKKLFSPYACRLPGSSCRRWWYFTRIYAIARYIGRVNHSKSKIAIEEK